MATIRLHNDCPNTYVSVPGIFIEKYIADANGEFVKVYLYLLHCMQSDSSNCSISSIADHFNHTENDIMRALRYWEKTGVLCLETDSKGEVYGIQLTDLYKCDFPATVSQSSAPKQTSTVEKTNKTVVQTAKSKASSVTTDTKKEYTLGEIQKFSQDPDMAELLFIMESYLKHPLSSSEMNTVFYWIDSLHFSKDLAEYLVEYCISGGHSSLRYMDKVALGWSEEGITTVDEAKSQGNNRSKSCYGVMKALGINGRNLIDSEVTLVNKWTKEYGFDMNLIEEACKRTISSTLQPSFEYTDSILTNWYKNQVHTLKDIETLDANFSKAKKASTTSRTVNTAKNNKFINFTQREYDYEALEKDILTSSV